MTAKGAKPSADVTIIIVAFRSRPHIRRCLEALAAQTVRPLQVILIENGSPQEERVTRDMVPDWVRFIENEDNLGFAGANNQAAALARARWLALLNPDAFAKPDWLEQLLAATKRWPEARLFGSTQLAADQPGYLDGAGDVYHVTGMPYRGGFGWKASRLPPEGEVFGPCAAAALIARDVFEALGGFDERFFCYCEDVDFAFRARLAGHRTVQVRDAVVEHVGYASTRRWSDFAMYHGVRNRLWTFIKNMPAPWIWLLLPWHVGATLIQLGAALRRKVFRAYWRGLWHGCRDLGPILRDRRGVQAARRASLTQVMRAMTWSPVAIMRRAPDVRQKVDPGDF
ncbi:MAG: glycosyltransferase family 2 protein [Maricaulaceae bacterium]|nr:glycosyltransferase family 2 protein [Maricaulaceae bacterium]